MSGLDAAHTDLGHDSCAAPIRSVENESLRARVILAARSPGGRTEGRCRPTRALLTAETEGQANYGGERISGGGVDARDDRGERGDAGFEVVLGLVIIAI